MPDIWMLHPRPLECHVHEPACCLKFKPQSSRNRGGRDFSVFRRAYRLPDPSILTSQAEGSNALQNRVPQAGQQEPGFEVHAILHLEVLPTPLMMTPLINIADDLQFAYAQRKFPVYTCGSHSG
jgi:hypothetical protein